jgi:hypothetical protein
VGLSPSATIMEKNHKKNPDSSGQKPDIIERLITATVAAIF